MIKKIDEFKNIPGYKGKYKISREGNFIRVYESGKIRELNPYWKRGYLIVKLTDDKRKSKELRAHALVAKTYLQKPKGDYVVRLINGVRKDIYLNNLEYIERQKLGKMTGARSRRKAVAKLDKRGEIIDFYTSARECARKNFINRQSITNKCNYKDIKRSIFADDGFAYSWDDGKKIRKTQKLIREEVGCKNDIFKHA